MNREPAMLSFSNKDVTYFDDPTSGDTVFKDVTLIAEGTWTDKESKKTIFYPSAALAKMQFKERTVRARHDIYSQLPVTNDIGIIENERFVTSPNPRWIGDVRIFPTQNGHDITTLLKHKQITDISPEFLHILTRNEAGGYTSSDILFMGATPVRTGACRLCTFNEGKGKGIDIDNDKYKDKDNDTEREPDMVNNPETNIEGTREGAGTDRALLEAQLADALKKVAELEKAPVMRTHATGRTASELEDSEGEWQSFMIKDFGD